MAIVEIARFKLKADADETAFLATEERLSNGQICQQKGFISREIAKGENGEWVVILHWESGEDSEAWRPKFMQDPDGQAFASQLDFSSMKQDRYHTIVF
jgi:heme-degrading monooxygenase HmoA